MTVEVEVAGTASFRDVCDEVSVWLCILATLSLEYLTKKARSTVFSQHEA